MSLISFVKEAGEKLFGRGPAKDAMAEAKSDPANEAKIAAANAAAGDAILDYIKAQNLSATGLTVTFDGATATASVFGVAPDQATKEKIALCAGNVAGVIGGQEHDVGRPERARGEVLHGGRRRQPVQDFQGQLRRSEQVHGDLRSQSADAATPGQDLSGSGAAYSAAVGKMLGDRDPRRTCPLDFIARRAGGDDDDDDDERPIGDPDDDEDYDDDDEDEDEEPLRV